MNDASVEPQVPKGMILVNKDTFFAALSADGRDIMPKHENSFFTTWETRSRGLWGWTAPGWKNTNAEKSYAIYPDALVTGRPGMSFGKMRGTRHD